MRANTYENKNTESNNAILDHSIVVVRTLKKKNSEGLGFVWTCTIIRTVVFVF